MNVLGPRHEPSCRLEVFGRAAAGACLVYLRLRRLLHQIVAHWLMDAGDLFVILLLPHLT